MCRRDGGSPCSLSCTQCWGTKMELDSGRTGWQGTGKLFHDFSAVTRGCASTRLYQMITKVKQEFLGSGAGPFYVRLTEERST